MMQVRSLSRDQGANIPGINEAPGDADLVVVQGSQVLALARATKTLVQERADIALVAGDDRHQRTSMLAISLLDVGTNMHHHGAEDDDFVLEGAGEVAAGRIVVLLRTVGGHQTVANARVETGANIGRVRVQKAVHAHFNVRESAAAFAKVHQDVVSQVHVLAALEESWYMRVDIVSIY